MEKKVSRVTGVVNIELIKKFMRINKLSHKKFAEMCGLSVYNLNKVLDNYSDFYVKFLFQIANAMNLEVYEILN